MSYRDKPDDVAAAEEYELNTRSHADQEPLLPRYEEAARRTPSPTLATAKHREARRRRFPFLCLGVTVGFILLIMCASAVYYKKNGGDLSGLEDKIPAPVKSWADKVLGDEDSFHHEDPNFPTE